MRIAWNGLQHQRGRRVARDSLQSAARPLNIGGASNRETLAGDEDVARLRNLEQDALCSGLLLEPDQKAGAEAGDRRDMKRPV